MSWQRRLMHPWPLLIHDANMIVVIHPNGTGARKLPTTALPVTVEATATLAP